MIAGQIDSKLLEIYGFDGWMKGLDMVRVMTL